MSQKRAIFGVLCLITVAAALPAEETRGHARNAVSGDNDIMDSIYSDCLRKDSVSCVKYKLFNFVDKVLSAREQFSLTDGVTVVRSPDAPVNEAARSISGDESFESLALNRISGFLNTHTIKVELKGADIVQAVSSTGRALEDVSESLFGGNDDPNAPEESRGKKKKAAKILGPILALVALKAAALLPLLLGAIALIAGKALLIGKIALVLSAVIGLKKLLSQEKHVTYEVVAHPHHSSSHSVSHDSYGSGYSADAGASGSYGSSGHGGWGRSLDAQDLAYAAQKPQA
ncbi:uncharacterized protein LOC101452265 [Ceratitis capitata]|uniref:(Mediterranean fruit fly) hypothetical protein n=1 Tax=Ceratitis capitata TaxID=7213 RepID=W8B803_CERCA|nr:uncharacterized protein LOC101452265 [Ceratitis capitata]CAD6993249.1 unnamed protein product [Ceratitis capitata]